ncbi:MAG: IS30 family transposase [Pseudomonadota bacterium]
MDLAQSELNLHERRAIADMLNAKMPVNKIAAEIGRGRSTVCTEIKRDYFTDDEPLYLSGYYGMSDQQYVGDRRARRRKPVRPPDFGADVVSQLKVGWTPELIAGRLGFEDQPVRASHERIYAYVYSAEGHAEQLARYLPGRRKKQQPRLARRLRGQVFQPDRFIHERPDYVKTRKELGDWESDLMILERSQGTMQVASLVERKTRIAILSCNNNRSSTHFITKLMSDGGPQKRPSEKM